MLFLYIKGDISRGIHSRVEKIKGLYSAESSIPGYVTIYAIRSDDVSSDKHDKHLWVGSYHISLVSDVMEALYYCIKNGEPIYKMP